MCVCVRVSLNSLVCMLMYNSISICLLNLAKGGFRVSPKCKYLHKRFEGMMYIYFPFKLSRRCQAEKLLSTAWVIIFINYVIRLM